MDARKKLRGGPKKASSSPRKIGDVLTDLMARRGYAQVQSAEECQQAWSNVVGDLGRFSRAGDVRRGVLHVIVANSVVLQELTFRKAEIVGALGRQLPSHRIQDVRFKIGEVQ